jgi:alkylation response protein AidB-like acyl-CoA dehydrogenase
MADATELLELKHNFEAVLTKECGHERLARHVATGRPLDSPLWAIVTGLGWAGLRIPVEHGGIGLGLDALIVLYRELGKVLAPVPLLSTILAAEAIRLSGNLAQQARWLPAIAEGERIAAISPIVASSLVEGRTEGGTIILRGDCALTADASIADLVVVQIRLDEAQHLVVVESDTAGMTIVPYGIADQTRSLARMSFFDCVVTSDSLLDGAATPGVLRAINNHAMLAIASDAVGGAEAILDRTLAYLKVREQFGRVIGSFQALKHRVADHKSELMMVETLLEEVAMGVVEDRIVTTDILAIKALATRMYVGVARDCIQLHGGIGFTWDYPAHLYLKRALLDRELFGSLANTLDDLARELVA